jgi:hypothetical protein
MCGKGLEGRDTFILGGGLYSWWWIVIKVSWWVSCEWMIVINGELWNSKESD